MSTRKSHRGVSLPSVGQVLVIAAAICAAWIFWSESRQRGLIPGGAAPGVDAQGKDQNAAPWSETERPSVDQLTASLANTIDPGVRRQALLTLSSIGPRAAEAIEPIRERLQDEDDSVRHAAVLALWRASRDPQVVLPELPAMLHDRAAIVRDVAATVMEEIGPPATALAIKSLGSESPAVRERAVLILERIVRVESLAEVRAAIEHLRDDPNPDVQVAALIAGAHFGRVDAAGIRVLLGTDHKVPAIQPSIERDRNSRDVALDEIAGMGPAGAEFVPDIIRLFDEIGEIEILAGPKQSKSFVPTPTFAPHVETILRTLSALKSNAQPAIGTLLRRIEALDPRSQPTLFTTLCDIGAEPEQLTPLLVPRLAETGGWSQHFAKLLVRADPAEAQRQVSLLMPKLANPNDIDPVVMNTFCGLALKSKEAVPTLISLLHDRTGSGASHYALLILKDLGPDASLAAPGLIAIIKQARAQGNIDTQRFVFETLGNIGPAARDAVPLLLDLLLDDTEPAAGRPKPKDQGDPTEQYTYHVSVIEALGKIALEQPDVQSAIRGQLASKSAARRAIAVRALAQSANGSPQVLAETIEMLENDTSRLVRASAALVFAGLPGDRRPAVAALTVALEDTDRDVRKMAGLALESVGPAAISSRPSLQKAWLEARVGIPSPDPPGPGSWALDRDNPVQRRLPLATVLRRALKAVEGAE